MSKGQNKRKEKKKPKKVTNSVIVTLMNYVNSLQLSPI
jgi:hypothetical protein